MSTDFEKFSSHCAERLKEERDRFKLSQGKIAEICGVSREIWGMYERGKSVPGGEVLFSFANHGADIQYIMTGKRSLFISEPIPEYGNLRPDQLALLDNLEHCTKEDQDAIKRMAFLAAKADMDETESWTNQKKA